MRTNAPIIQINDDFYEDLDYETTSMLLDNLRNGDLQSQVPLSEETSRKYRWCNYTYQFKETDGVVPAFSKTIDSK